MNRKPYKNHKRGAGQHVQLPEWFQASEAWATLKPGPRALYVELKRRYNGHNNGTIILSHRDAAKALNVNRNTVGPWFTDLMMRGLISMTQGPHLGPSGIGKASLWSLEELPDAQGRPASKAFMRWKQIQKPRPNNRTPRPNKQDTTERFVGSRTVSVLKFGTQ